MKCTGLLFALLVLLIDVNQSFAQGDLMIYPRRLVFESNQRSMDMTLANTGTDSSSYTLSWKNYRMTATGQFEELTEPDSGQYFTDQILRFYPREVTLGPGESQKVRVQRISARKLPDGEYRSHLEFRSIKPMESLGLNQGSNSQDGIQTKLNMHLAITIPVIMEIGNVTSSVRLQNPKLITSENLVRYLQFEIIREGNKSCYGDFTIIHRGEDGRQTKVALVRGVAVYTPLFSRMYSLPLNIPAELNELKSGTLILEYITQSRRKEVLATLEFPLN